MSLGGYFTTPLRSKAKLERAAWRPQEVKEIASARRAVLKMGVRPSFLAASPADDPVQNLI